MHRLLRTSARWSAAVITTILLAGCGASEDDAPAEPQFADDTSIASVDSLISDVVYGSGEPVPLSDATTAAWDEVAIFPEGASVGEIEELVGETGLFGDTYVASHHLLVFRSEGSVATLLQSTSDLIEGEYATLLGADAVLRLENGDSGPVILTSPGGA